MTCQTHVRLLVLDIPHAPFCLVLHPSPLESQAVPLQTAKQGQISQDFHLRKITEERVLCKNADF